MHRPLFVIRAQLTMEQKHWLPILCVHVLMPAKGGCAGTSYLLENLISMCAKHSKHLTTVYLVFSYTAALLWPPSATMRTYHPYVYFRCH